MRRNRILMTDPLGREHEVRERQVGVHLFKGWLVHGLTPEGGLDRPDVIAKRENEVRKEKYRKELQAERAEEERTKAVREAKELAEAKKREAAKAIEESKAASAVAESEEAKLKGKSAPPPEPKAKDDGKHS